MSSVPAGDRAAMVEAIMGAIRQGGLFAVDVDIVPSQDRRGLPRLAAGRDLGRDEPDLDERRAPHAADRALHGPARPGHARLPDRRAASPTTWSRRSAPLGDAVTPTSSRASTGRPRRTPSWTATTQHEKGGEFVTYERLRAMGTNGFQEPATGFDGRQDRRHQAALRRRQVRQGRQGQVHGDRSGAACRRRASRSRRTSSPT